MNLSSRFTIGFFGLFIVILTSFFWRTLEWNENNNLSMLANSRAVPAKIESTSIRESLETVANNEQQSTMYEPVVTYTYEMNGQKHESSRWRLSTAKTGIRSWAEGDLAPFKPGQEVTAWVDPNDSANAVLVHAVDFFLYGFSIFISVPILLGFELLLMGLVPIRQDARATAWQEAIFDLPCLVWFFAVGQKLFQYFSNSSSSRSIWAYVFTVLWLLFSAFLVNCRIRNRSLSVQPPAGQLSAFGRVTGKQTGIDGFTTRGGGKDQDTLETNRESGRASGQWTVQKRPNRALALIPVAMFLIAAGSQIWRIATWQDKSNPELRTVYFSKEHAIKEMPMHDADIKKEPNNPWSYKQRGLNYFDAEEYQKAIDDFSVTLAKIEQPDDQTLSCRARAYMLTNQWQKALADFQTLNKIAKKPWELYCANRGLGICNYHLKKYKEAVQNFTKSLEEGRQSDCAELLHDRALCYQHLGQIADAESDFKAVPFWRSSSYWLQ